MRLIHLSTTADPVGGAEVYALGLVEELRRRGHEVGFFGTSTERSVSRPELRVVQRADYDKELLLQDPGTLQALRDYLDEFDPELIHIHNLYALGIDLVRVLAETGIPLVQTVHDFAAVCPISWCVRGDGTSCAGGAGAQCFQHDCSSNHSFDAKDALVTRLREELLRGSVRAFLCPSHHLVRTLTDRGFQNVCHLPYFAPVEGAAAEGKRELERLVFLGRLTPEKGLTFLLRAMPAVVERFPSVELAIVGDGPQREELEDLVESLGLESTVKFTGKVSHERVQELMRTATAGLVPSIWTENSPVSIYESMIAGLPMIGSRIGGIPDLIDDGRTGFLFEPRNETEIAASITRFLSLSIEQRQAFSMAAREKGKGYTREKNVRSVEAIYAEVLGAVNGSRSESAPTVSFDEDMQAIMHRLLGELYSFHDLADAQVGFIRELEGEISDLKHGKLRPTSLKRRARGFARKLGLPKVLGAGAPKRNGLQPMSLKRRAREYARKLGLPKVFR